MDEDEPKFAFYAKKNSEICCLCHSSRGLGLWDFDCFVASILIVLESDYGGLECHKKLDWK